MKVILKFDYYKKTIHIPDGYIEDLEKVYLDFFEWLYEQPENRVYFGLDEDGNDEYGLEYGSNDFVRYLNEVILKESDKKAHYVKRKMRKRMPVLEF